MTVALWLLALQGTLGASDTLYYHELRARLPALGPRAAAELRLHAVRDFIYAVVFATLPWLEWRGALTGVLAVLLAAEIAITLSDFVVEDRIRAPIGGVYPGERVMHAVMGIVYGAFLAHLVPAMQSWWGLPTTLATAAPSVPEALRWVLTAMGAGVFLSGVRDLCASFGMPFARWPHPAVSLPRGEP